MKRKAIYIVLLLFLNQLHLFSQEYFVEHISSLKVFYESKLVDLQPIRDFCNENDYSKAFKFCHDRYCNKYYILVRSSDYKFFRLFELEKGHVSNIPKYKINMKKDSVFCGIYNWQILFWSSVHGSEYRYLIYNLSNGAEKTISINEKGLPILIGFNGKRIFFCEGYFDLNSQAYTKYQKSFSYPFPSIDNAGDRLVGIDEEENLIIYNVNTETITKTGIKQKLNAGSKYNSTGLYSLNGDFLYFSKPNDLHLLDWMFCSNYEKHKWYKKNLTTGKIKRIKQPSGYAEIY